MKFIGFSDLHLNNDTKPPFKGQYPVRVLDVLANLQLVVDTAIDKQVDWVFFGGDAYYTHTPPQEFKTLFQNEMIRLKDAGIPFALVPGNHDMTKRASNHHALKEFETLKSGALVFNAPTVYNLATFDLVGIPWQHETLDLTFLQGLRGGGIPAICVAHCSVAGATYQTGQTIELEPAEVVLGKEFILPLAFFDQFDFTLLGHIHQPQVLSEQPPVLYPGSCERLTWGEMGQPHYCVYGETTPKGVYWEPIFYYARERIEVIINTLDDLIDYPVDPTAMYRVRYDAQAIVTPQSISNHFRKAFRVDLKRQNLFETKKRPAPLPVKNMSNTAILKLWCAENNIDFETIEELWYQTESEI